VLSRLGEKEMQAPASSVDAEKLALENRDGVLAKALDAVPICQLGVSDYAALRPV